MARASEPIRKRVRLIHWRPAEARPLIGALAMAGYEVDASPVTDGGAVVSEIKARLPDVVVIDLSRLPSHGREVARHLRSSRGTRDVSLVFVGGSPGKVAAVRAVVPNAMYAGGPDDIVAAMKEPMRRPAKATGAATSKPGTAGYSGKPTIVKLGIKPGSVVRLIGAPEDFAGRLGALPDGARYCSGSRDAHTLSIWCIRTKAELAKGMPQAVRLAEHGTVWVAWPKKTSPLAGDVGESDVRAAALPCGLVDYKVCAIDADWSGLALAKRKS